MAEVIVIGGGITGLTTAYELALRGYRVVVLEARKIGAMGSGWTLGGVRQSGRDPAELPLARAAVKRWMTLDDELEGQTGYRQGGNLRLARSPAEIETIRALVVSQKAAGLDIEFLSENRDIRAVAPALSPAILAASLCPGDGHADPDLTLAAYARALLRRNVDLREGEAALSIEVMAGRVTGVRTANGLIGAEKVVLAAGIHAPELLRPLGLDVPLLARQVAVIRTVPVGEQLKQVFGVANADCAGRQQIDGSLRVTTGIGPWPGDPARWTIPGLRPSANTVSELIDRVRAILPGFGQIGIDQVWGGLIDLTPDGLPVLDQAPGFDGLVIATGLSGHGFGIGPVVGEILAGLVCGEPARFALAPFRYSRFDSTMGQAPLTLHG